MPASEPRIMSFEKREAMPECKRLVFTFWLMSALALLVAVLIAPFRTSGFAKVSSGSHFMHRSFAIPSYEPVAFWSVGIGNEAVDEGTALPSEDEELERADALDEPQVSFLIPVCFRKVPDRQLIAPCSVLSLYPLRC